MHGDLTPGNVMLATSGVVKVIDFGIARIMRRPLEAVKTFLGRERAFRRSPPPYASPQLIETRRPDPSDDVYSLGCIAWER